MSKLCDKCGHELRQYDVFMVYFKNSKGKNAEISFNIGDIFINKQISNDFLFVTRLENNRIYFEGKCNKKEYDYDMGEFLSFFGINEASIMKGPKIYLKREE